MAQPKAAVEEDAICRDLRRLMQAAPGGFAPFIVRQISGPAVPDSRQAVTFDATPIAGFESARVFQAGRRADGGKSKVSVYVAHYPPIRRPGFGATPQTSLENRIAVCLSRPVARDQYGYASFKTGDIEVRLRAVPNRVYDIFISLEVGSPTLCPEELKHVLGCTP